MTGRRRGRLHMSRAYFFAFPGICVVRFWLSCFDLAWAALSALTAFFCFWSRSFDLGDLSPTGASIRWLSPSVHTIAVAPSEGKRSAGADDVIGNLSFEVTQGDLREAFAAYGR